MRIVIDLQAAQTTGSRHRGIGRYSMALAKAMAQDLRGHQLIIALNGRFEDSISAIRAELDGLVPPEDIRIWYASGSDASEVRNCADDLIRESFICAMKPDIVHVTSMFEGLGDASTSSIGTFTNRLLTAVTLFDLIPYIYRRQYLADPAVERWYLSKLAHLRRADLLLGISESARCEAVEYLGIPEARTVNISSAVGEEFRRIEISAEEERALRAKYGLERPFLMYTGGIDHRKNIDGLIRAFAGLPEALKARYQLAVVCSASEQNKQSLRDVANEEGLEGRTLVLTGFVPEQDLIMLYNLCTLFVFPSWHEGFGLPALEAMHCGAPVVAADTSSLPEVVGRPDALFDPRDVVSMTGKICQALTDDKFRADLATHGLRQAKGFTWQKTAARALDAFEDAVSTRSRPLKPAGDPHRRPRLAYLSPLPSERSGIADYSAQLLPDLSRYYDIDVVTPQAVVADQAVLGSTTLRSVEWFEENAEQYDRVVYHFGNSEFHQHMFALLEKVPGVVVLHDFFLSGILEHMSLVPGARDSWPQALYLSHGYRALIEQSRSAASDDLIYRYPCNFPVLQKSIGTIVHSEHSRTLAAEWYGAEMASELIHIPLLRGKSPVMEKKKARASLGIGEDAFVVCTFGLVNPTKQCHRLFKTWLSALGKHRECHLFFVGENHAGAYGEELASMIQASSAAKRVHITGWTDADTYRAYLAAADVAVQLRALSRGETSAAVLDCMGHGLATIVNANGSMATLPLDSVVMVPDDFIDSDLIEALTELHLDPERRQALGDAAREVVAIQHSPAQCSQQYADAIEAFYDRDLVSERALVADLGRLLSPESTDADVESIAEAVALTHPARKPARQLFVDVTHLVNGEGESSEHPMLLDLLSNPPAGFRTEPIYAAEDGTRYLYARRFTLELVGATISSLNDEVVEIHPHDRYVGLVPRAEMTQAQLEFVESLKHRGVEVAGEVAGDSLPAVLAQSRLFSPGLATH